MTVIAYRTRTLIAKVSFWLLRSKFYDRYLPNGLFTLRRDAYLVAFKLGIYLLGEPEFASLTTFSPDHTKIGSTLAGFSTQDR